jgi:hypothetical protein
LADQLLMTNDIRADGSSRLNTQSLDTTDRLLLGAAAALWLTALGAGVAAVVALSNLGGVDSGSGGESDTPWLLYAVIAVSVIVIVAAVPLLIRARRAALEGQTGDAATPEAAASRPDRTGGPFGDPVATTNLRAPGAPTIRRQSMPPPASSRVGFPTAAVERIFLRCPAGIAAAMGAAATLIGTATYLSATDHDTPAWIAYGLAGLVIVAMPIIPVVFLRQLRSVLA